MAETHLRNRGQNEKKSSKVPREEMRDRSRRGAREESGERTRRRARSGSVDGLMRLLRLLRGFGMHSDSNQYRMESGYCL